MDFGTDSRKRTLSDMDPTSEPSRKRARLSPVKPSKPILRVNCTVGPQRPKPQPFVSPLSFSIESSTTITSSIQSGHTSARFYQDQFSSQVYDCYQTYNHQPQSYAQPPDRSPAPPYWPGFSGYQPAWTTTPREPYGSYNFAEMCQTSASRSVYTAFSNGNEHARNVASGAPMDQPVGLPHQSGDTRRAFVDALRSCIINIEDVLLAEQGKIKEILQVLALFEVSGP